MTCQQQPDAGGLRGSDRQGLVDGSPHRAQHTEERMGIAKDRGRGVDVLERRRRPPGGGWSVERGVAGRPHG